MSCSRIAVVQASNANFVRNSAVQNYIPKMTMLIQHTIKNARE